MVRHIKNTAELRAVVDEINPIKSRLLECYNRLMRSGCVAEAQSLDRIIARLEAWQARV